MKNDYKICGDYTIIYIDSPKYGLKECLIDTEDLDIIKYYKWSISFDKTINGFYVRNITQKNNIRKTYNIHRLVMKCPSGLQVDHINHNTLDNRKSNLRNCTQAENVQNIRVPRRNKTGVIGLNWSKRDKKWSVKFKVNKKDIWVGYFRDFEEAKKVALRERAKYFPFSREACLA